MNKRKLIEKGYFAKELPPCFTTKSFADNFDSIFQTFTTTKTGVLGQIIERIQNDQALTNDDKAVKKHIEKTKFNNRLKNSTCIKYNIPKVGLIRKEISIPNPLHQGLLIDAIAQNSSSIEEIYNQSNISVTIPYDEPDESQGKRAVKHDTYTTFKEKCVLDSFDKQIQLKTDISKYYHSIYTHAIPWTTLGKKAYKANYALGENDPNKQKDLFGDAIDTAIRNCQAGQTKGIPIGPDTSLISAEMIGCTIDYLLSNQLKKDKIVWTGYRYYDDFFLYFNRHIDAEIAIERLQSILAVYELELNIEKTEIQDKPIQIEEDWALRLKTFFFRILPNEQREDIWNYFAMMLNFSKDFPKASVIKFGLNKFKFVRIEKNNWEFFERLLFKIGLIETSSLQMIAKILCSYKSLTSKKRIKSFAFEIIKQHYNKNHDFELTWALWLIKKFKISIRKDIAELVAKSKSVMANVLLLDLLSTKSTNVNIENIISEITEESLSSYAWLLSYESIHNNWISSVNNSIVSNDFFFNILSQNNVSFYDPTVDLEPLRVPKSIFKNIIRKTGQVENSIKRLKSKNTVLTTKLKDTLALLKLYDEDKKLTRKEIQKRLSETEKKLHSLIDEVIDVKETKMQFDEKKLYFVLEKRLEELRELTIKELEYQEKEDNDLLYNPDYE